MTTDRFRAIEIFVRVVETASFTRAAHQLAVPRSTVSTVIQGLEARLGSRLLNRTTRHVTVTADGEAYYERCLRLLADLEEAETAVRGSAEPSGRLRIDVPSRVGRLVLAPALPEFLDRYPRIAVTMGTTDRLVDLVAEGIDAAVRVGQLSDSALLAHRVGELTMATCASPAYLARHGTPDRPGDLAGHAAIGYASSAVGETSELELGSGPGARRVVLPARVTVDSAEAYIACCIAGLGLIQVPAYDVRSHLDAGDLVEVLPALRSPPLPLSILYPHRRHLSQRLRSFVGWADGLFRRTMELAGADGGSGGPPPA